VVDGVGDECVNYLEERDLHILQGFKRCQDGESRRGGECGTVAASADVALTEVTEFLATKCGEPRTPS
jgi:hypothetical protein